MKSRRQIIKTVMIFAVSSLLLCSFFSFSASASSQEPPKTSGYSAACLYDKTHSKVLLMENGDTPLNTSTSAKVMMGLLACEMLQDRIDETITLTESMLEGSSGYSMKLKAGESIKMIDLLYGALCGSYNDAAYVLASICAGSSPGFVTLMNEKAASLGAASTSYTNPLGYPDNDAMKTTLHDTLKIAEAASDNELYMQICSAKSHTIPATNLSSARTVNNRNRLLFTPPNTSSAYFNSKCLGMNAGSSGDSGGWSLITLARDDGADYICVILGGKESADSEIYAYSVANTLINWACKSHDSVNLFKAGDILGTAEITMTAFGSQNAAYTAASDLDVYIPSERRSDVELRIEYTKEELRAPIKAGEKIGVAAAYLDGERLGASDILLKEDCEANSVMKVIDAIGNYTKSRAFIASIIFFAIALPIALIVAKRRNSMHRRRKRKY